ncbi:hypothetical protein GGX14DRAFT_566310 [Mycena pura]|uniref:Uncharacterized protein n=1 Tax=Mycena pura TaxID=153505 RepID=A0AAD6Y9S1_9AGAR|nr:hypothetical protein GGX14DRAFT_566310 [Mycena pura]
MDRCATLSGTVPTTTPAAAHDAAGQNPHRYYAPCSDPVLDRARRCRKHELQRAAPVAEPPAYARLRNPSSPSAESNSMSHITPQPCNIVTTSPDSARFARAPRPLGSRPDGYNGSVAAAHMHSNLRTPSARRRGTAFVGVMAGTACPAAAPALAGAPARTLSCCACGSNHLAAPPNLTAAPFRPAVERSAQQRKHAELGVRGYVCPIAHWHVPKVRASTRRCCHPDARPPP